MEIHSLDKRLLHNVRNDVRIVQVSGHCKRSMTKAPNSMSNSKVTKTKTKTKKKKSTTYHHDITVSLLHALTISRHHVFTLSLFSGIRFSGRREFGFHDITIPRHHDITTSPLHALTTSRLHAITPSRLHALTTSRHHAQLQSPKQFIKLKIKNNHRN